MVEISKLALIQILGINTNKIPDAQIALQLAIFFILLLLLMPLKPEQFHSTFIFLRHILFTNMTCKQQRFYTNLF